MSILTVLAARRDTIVQAWLDRLLDSYSEQGARFIRTERDPFRNPVGQALGGNLPALFDELVGELHADRTRAALEAILRVRAVQDVKPARVLGFVFALKRIAREALAGESAAPTADDWLQFDGRIDEVGLLAFDVLLECRERLYEIRTNEARRRVHVLERMIQRAPLPADTSPAPADSSDGDG